MKARFAVESRGSMSWSHCDCRNTTSGARMRSRASGSEPTSHLRWGTPRALSAACASFSPASSPLPAKCFGSETTTGSKSWAWSMRCQSSESEPHALVLWTRSTTRRRRPRRPPCRTPRWIDRASSSERASASRRTWVADSLTALRTVPSSAITAACSVRDVPRSLRTEVSEDWTASSSARS